MDGDGDGDGDDVDRSPSSSEKMRNLMGLSGQVDPTPPSLSLALSASTRHPPQADNAAWGPHVSHRISRVPTT